ncbi:unnamed protein product [Psylliodes chrysocephalus]|uniref:Uncharacterized protein n=1 Tax=Psylliodes chrysocephalus TaxID=3402493 RepID=A0A9P0DF02_9CUCU|nr:unnamed protein product [Psylliodes chrysocephala]
MEEANVIMQEELITIRTDEELEQKFNQGYQNFWLQRNIETHYPVLWNIAEKYFNAFPSSYLVEKGFSVVTNILIKQRNRLKINERGYLRLQLTNIEPNLAKLVESHQAKIGKYKRKNDRTLKFTQEILDQARDRISRGESKSESDFAPSEVTDRPQQEQVKETHTEIERSSIDDSSSDEDNDTLAKVRDSGYYKTKASKCD